VGKGEDEVGAVVNSLKDGGGNVTLSETREGTKEHTSCSGDCFATRIYVVEGVFLDTAKVARSDTSFEMSHTARCGEGVEAEGHL